MKTSPRFALRRSGVVFDPFDATVPEAWGELVRRCGGAPSGPSWVVTNPPFSHAGPIAWLALQHARRGPGVVALEGAVEGVDEQHHRFGDLCDLA